MSNKEYGRITAYNGKVWGITPSGYSIQNGYLDYWTLGQIAKMDGGLILNNNIINHCIDDWYCENGTFYLDDEERFVEVYQYYIISDSFAERLQRISNELVFYNEKLDIYLWGITHFGTSWDYVLTNLKHHQVNGEEWYEMEG